MESSLLRKMLPQRLSMANVRRDRFVSCGIRSWLRQESDAETGEGTDEAQSGPRSGEGPVLLIPQHDWTCDLFARRSSSVSHTD